MPSINGADGCVTPPDPEDRDGRGQDVGDGQAECHSACPRRQRPQVAVQVATPVRVNSPMLVPYGAATGQDRLPYAYGAGSAPNSDH